MSKLTLSAVPAAAAFHTMHKSAGATFIQFFMDWAHGGTQSFCDQEN